MNIYNSNNEIHTCRALLDSGSQMNFVTQELANRLQLKERSLEMSVAGIMGRTISAKNIVNVTIKSRFNNFSENIDCVVLPRITQPLPKHIHYPSRM